MTITNYSMRFVYTHKSYSGASETNILREFHSRFIEFQNDSGAGIIEHIRRRIFHTPGHRRDSIKGSNAT